MNNNAWFKKENPFQTVIGFGGGATGFGAYSSASKTYVDDVFKPYVWMGTGSNITVDNGIDLSSKDGMVWYRGRNYQENFSIEDTVRGLDKVIYSDTTSVEADPGNYGVQAFNSNGFQTGLTNNGYPYGNWCFREAPGFFDIVSYTGNGTSQTISHSLKSIPGVIMIKNLSNATNWVVYHRCGGVAQAVGGNYSYFTKLNTTAGEVNNTNMITATPTASSFTLGDNSDVNQNSDNYIAYIFAGGESTAATAKSVDFTSSTDLAIPDNDAWTLGTTFTVEAWIRPDNFDNDYNTIVSQSDGSNDWYMSVLGGGGSDEGKLQFWNFTGGGSNTTPFQHEIQTKVWTHVAFVSNSGSGQWYVNGTATGAPSSSVNITSGTGGLKIGRQGTGYQFDGKISNLRIVKGTAVYTSSFKPSTAPLTNITNTVLLCCNDSSVTGSTVTPATITSNGPPSASDRNPFDDSEGFKFGENGDQNIIKTGEYLGRASTLNPVVDLGWEPQFIMIKSLTTTGPWLMFDSIRNIKQGDSSYVGQTPYLRANSDAAEVTNTRYIELTPTGFKIMGNYSDVNTSFETYGYIAIRRPDGWVSKPAEAATEVFNMGQGQAGGSPGGIPNYISGFPPDGQFVKETNASNNFYFGSRLTGEEYIIINSTAVRANSSTWTWDCMTGYNTGTSDSDWVSWLWKRGPGFDVVAYEGDSQNSRILRHSLGAEPEMIWIKNRDSAATNWIVGHIGLDGGNEPWTHAIYLNEDEAELDYDFFMDKAPTAYSFEVTTASVNDSNTNYVAWLFRSVTGISKVGTYSGSASGQTITLGFQPRFIIIRNTAGSRNWVMFDTLRGWGAGNDEELSLNKPDAQGGNNDRGEPTATGFTVGTGNDDTNGSGFTYIYYAHA